MISNRVHMASGGSFCPFCRSEQIEGNDFTIENGKCYQEMRCLDCDAEWEDIYRLHRYRVTRMPPEEEENNV